MTSSSSLAWYQAPAASITDVDCIRQLARRKGGVSGSSRNATAAVDMASTANPSCTHASTGTAAAVAAVEAARGR